MKKIFTLLVLILFSFSNRIYAQLNLKVQLEKIRVLSTVDCDAGVGDDSDFLFEFKATDNSSFAYTNNSPVAGSIGQCNFAYVNENNGPFSFIPTSPGVAVFTPTNGVFFNHNYNCKSDVPSKVTIVWRGYENDDVTQPSVLPTASGTTAISTTTVSVALQSAYVQSFQYTLTSSDAGCPQIYEATFSVLVTYGAFVPLFIDHIHESTICIGANNGQLEGHPLGGSGTVLNDWSTDGLGDYDDPLLITGLAAGTYTFVAEDALNCRDTLIAHILAINPPANISSFTASTPTVCTGQMGVLYSVPTQTTVNYMWSYSGSGITFTNNPNSDFSINYLSGSTSGVLSVYAQNSCSVSPTLTIAINVTPTPTVVISGNTSMCDNTQETLTVMGASNYLWNTGASTSTIVITPTTTTVYSVTGSNGSCASTNQFTMSVIASPTVNISGPGLAVCPNNTVALSANGNGSVFVWSDGFIGSSHTISAAATTIYTVSNVLNSCVAQAMYTLNVNPLPVISVTGNTITCPGKTLTLTASGANTYSWSSGSSGTSITYTPSALTTLTVTGTNSVTSCVNTKTISVNAFPAGLVSITGNTIICSSLQGVLTASGSDFYLWNNGATANTNTITPTGPTTVSVVGTTLNGCKDSTSLPINVISNLSISIIGPDSICLGQSAALFANVTGATTYSWSTGVVTQSVIVSPVITSTYVVTASNAGCTASQQHILVVSYLPEINFTEISPLCTESGIYTLTATPTNGTYFGTGILGDTFDPSVGVGTYPITYQATGVNGCVASSTQTIEVIICVGIKNYTADHSINLYPNPTQGIVTILSSSYLRSVYVFDYTGKMLKQIELNSEQEAKINLLDLPHGFYTFVVTTANGTTQTLKVVKE